MQHFLLWIPHVFVPRTENAADRMQDARTHKPLPPRSSGCHSRSSPGPPRPRSGRGRPKQVPSLHARARPLHLSARASARAQTRGASRRDVTASSRRFKLTCFEEGLKSQNHRLSEPHMPLEQFKIPGGWAHTSRSTL